MLLLTTILAVDGLNALLKRRPHEMTIVRELVKLLIQCNDIENALYIFETTIEHNLEQNHVPVGRSSKTAAERS